MADRTRALDGLLPHAGLADAMLYEAVHHFRHGMLLDCGPRLAESP